MIGRRRFLLILRQPPMSYACEQGLEVAVVRAASHIVPAASPGYRPTVGLEAGMAATADWYVEQGLVSRGDG